ncbi:unnamed protein product [Chrysoparadoxa australica]
MARFRAAFPSHPVKLLVINSLPPESPNMSQPDLWPGLGLCDSDGLAPNSGAAKGRLLSPDDILAIKSFVDDIASKVVLPEMERKIHTLNALVSGARKGVKNVLKSMLWRKPSVVTASSSAPSKDSGVEYRHDRIESQIRHLADCAFVMRDYETALSMYKMARDDFRADRAMFHLGAASHMVAVCALLLEGEGKGSAGLRKEVELGLSTALESYAKCAAEASRPTTPSAHASTGSKPSLHAAHSVPKTAKGILATRMCTWIALMQSDAFDMMTTGDTLDVEAAEALVLASSHECYLSSAVCLEVASWHFLRADLRRKFCFHAVMAGHMYRAAAQPLHSVRCYTAAMGGYKPGWGAVACHVESSLAHGLAQLSFPSKALLVFLQLLVHSGGSRARQSCPEDQLRFIRFIVRLCKTHPGQAALAAQEWGQPTFSVDLMGSKATDAVQASSGTSSAQGMDLLGMDLLDVPEQPQEDRTIVFHGLPLPRVHNQLTEVLAEGVRTAGEAHKASQVEVEANSGGTSAQATTDATESDSDWIKELKVDLRNELLAAAEVESGEGPWLDVAVAVPEKQRREAVFMGLRKLTKPKPKWRATEEPLSLQVVLENPLKVPLSLGHLRLTAEIRPFEAPERMNLDDERLAAIPTGKLAVMSQEEFDHRLGSAGLAGLGSSKPSASASDLMHALVPGASIVVDQRDITLNPGEKRVVRLRLCPLVTGVVRVTGMTWRLFQDEFESDGSGCLLASHKLDIQGPLLQDTLAHRCTRARAPCPVLHAAVVGAMPLLDAAVEGVPDTLLQGEVVKATLSLKNLGRAAAGHIYLKASLPWVTFQDDAAVDAADAQHASMPVGCAVGASGMVLQPPVPVLEPGAVVKIPMWVRGRGGGRHTLRLLLSYKRAFKETAADAAEAARISKFERFVPLTLGICVLPSLSVAASVLPSYTADGEYVLSLELTNYRSPGSAAEEERGIRILKVCSLSRYWHMEPLTTGAVSCSMHFTHSLNHSLAPTNQSFGSPDRLDRLTLHYRLFLSTSAAQAAPDQAADLPVKNHDCWVIWPYSSHKSGDSVGSTCTPHIQLLCLEHAASSYAAAQKAYLEKLMAEEAASAADHPMTIQGIRRDKERAAALEEMRLEEEERVRQWHLQHHCHPASPSALSPPESSLINLMVLWEGGSAHPTATSQVVQGPQGGGGVASSSSSDSAVRYGQHHVRSLVICPQSVDRQCPLVLNVEHPSVVSALPREAELSLRITNRLASPAGRPIDFTFEVKPREEARRTAVLPDAEAVTSTPAQCYVWLGPTKRTVLGLKPGKSCDIYLRVRFLRNGVFDLNQFRCITHALHLAFTDSHPFSAPSPSTFCKFFRLTAGNSPKSHVTFVFPTQYLISVAAQ